MPRIALLQYYDNCYKTFHKNTIDISIKNKTEYCAENGYDYILCSDKETGSPVYQRMEAIYKLSSIDKGSYYDFVFHCDMDCLIMNFDILLEDLIGKYDDDTGVFFLSKNSQGPLPGNMFVRTKECKYEIENMLFAIMNEEGIEKNSGWISDRPAFDLMMKDRPDRFVIMDQKEICPFWTNVTGNDCVYSEGDFLVHFPGLFHHPDKLEELMGNYSLSRL